MGGIFFEVAMDHVRHGEIQGRYLVFFKAHGPVFYHVWHSPYKMLEKTISKKQIQSTGAFRKTPSTALLRFGKNPGGGGATAPGRIQ